MEQTAVEWLVDELLSGKTLMPSLIEQAKEMEKQQIINAWLDGGATLSAKNAEQYYNETFKSETVVTEFRDGTVKVETFKKQ